MFHRKKFSSCFRLIGNALLVLMLVFTPTVYAADGEKTPTDDTGFDLTIMHMNDTHAHVEPMPKMVTAVKDIREKNPNSLLFHAGDVFSGTLYFNEFKGQADLAMLNLMKPDAMVFGNHEFDLGDKEGGHKSLAEFVKKADFPFLGTNTDFSRDPFMKDLVSTEKNTDRAENGKIYNTIIKEVDGEKIGIFGLTTEDTKDISSPVNVTFTDFIEAAKEAVATLEKQGVNKIIAVNHIGYNSDPKVGNDLLLADNVDGIDIIVGGHSHTELAEPVLIDKDEPTIIVQAFQYAEYLGKLDVHFDENGVVTSYSGKLISVQEQAEDKEASEVLAPFKAKVDEKMNEKIGAVAVKTLANPRQEGGKPGNSVRANETELGNLVTDAMLAKAKEKYPNVSIAIQNGGGIREAIEKGPITAGEVISVLPFGNDPVIMTLTGAEIKAALEHSVRQAPYENGGFLHVSGMKFTYDSEKEAGARVQTIEVKQGDKFVPIDNSKKYFVTTNAFTGAGGDGFDVFKRASDEGRVKDIGEIDWEQLRDYMVEKEYLDGVVDPVIEGRIIDLAYAEVEDPEDDNKDPGDGGEVNDGHPENLKPGDGTSPGDGDCTGTDCIDNNDDNPVTPGDNQDDKGNNQAKTDNKDDSNINKDGSKLPKTATNMFSYMLVGIILLAVGGVTLIIRKKRIE